MADKNEHAGRILSIYPKGGHDGEMICDLIGCDNAFANADLIAAAPEMIYALKLAKTELDKMGCECDCETLPARCPVCAVNHAISLVEDKS